MARLAIFLDRDGTINFEKEYLYRIEAWDWIPGAIEAIKIINSLGYLAIVVTNQAGVARGYYSEKDVQLLHTKVDEMLALKGAKIDAYYYCPHHSEYGAVRNCECRKPKSGMFLNAKKDFDIDLSKSWMIGDKAIDMEAAISVGISPILALTGYGESERSKLAKNITIEKNILSAIRHIEKQRSSIEL